MFGLISTLTLSTLVHSAPVLSSTVTDPGVRAAIAAERAALAAQKAAEAAARAAAAYAGVTETAADGAKHEISPWGGNAGVGLIWLSGNSQTLTLSGNVSMERKSEDWIWGAKANGAYGQTRPAGTNVDPEVVALSAGLMLRGDRRFNEKVSGYLATGADMDHVKSIEIRPTGEAGAGIIWHEQKYEDFLKSSLRTDLGFRYSKEFRFQYFPVAQDLDDVDFAAPRLGVAFRYGITRDITFTEDVEVMPNIVGESRVLANSTSKLSARLTQVLSFGVGFALTHDSRPASGKKATDSALTLGLEVAI